VRQQYAPSGNLRTKPNERETEMEMLFLIALTYVIFKMQQTSPKDAAKREALTAACTDDLRRNLGREPKYSEIQQAVLERYQAEADAQREAKAARKAERKAAKAAQRHS